MASKTKNPFVLKLSAPGKVILCGEYSVVFSKPAIAATLCLRTKLHLTETDTDLIQLNFSAVQLDATFPLKVIKKHLKLFPTEKWETYVDLLTCAVENIYKETNDAVSLNDAQKNSLIIFFHCFSKVLQSCQGFTLKVDSELPVGSGVGSSASFSVVLSAAALLYHQHDKGSDFAHLTKRTEVGTKIICDTLLSQISETAFSCEKIFHGSPSGIDHNTILGGSMLEFIKSEGNNKITFIDACPIKILLVNTNVPRSTKKLVASVKQLKENLPKVIECVLEAMENIAKNALMDLIKLKENQSEADKLQIESHFGELISINHKLLRVLGVSHPTLEQIVSTAEKYNLNAKLTGAGGGGFGFIYLPSNIDSSVVKTLQNEFNSISFSSYEVILGGPGLTIDE